MGQTDRFEGLADHAVADSRVKRQGACARVGEETAQGRTSNVGSAPVLRSAHEMAACTPMLSGRQDCDLPHLDYPW